MRHRMWEKYWENWKLFISTIYSRAFILLYLYVEFNKHSKFLRSGIRIVDKETHGGVNWCTTQLWTQQLVVWRPWGRAPGCEMTSPLIYRQTPTGDRNQRDSGKPETSLVPFSNSEKNLGEAGEERGRASSRHNSRCSAGDAKEFKGWKDVNAGCKACEPIDFYESLLKMPAEAEWMQRKRQHVEIFPSSFQVMLCDLVTLWWQRGSPGTHSVAPLIPAVRARVSFHARMLYNLISSEGAVHSNDVLVLPCCSSRVPHEIRRCAGPFRRSVRKRHRRPV